MVLTRSTDPLVWVDCEMTGLDATHDTILSISVFITSSTLELLEPLGLTLYIHHSAEQLSHMSEWCQTTHTASGLVAIVTDPTRSTTAAAAAAQTLQYIQQHIPRPRTGLLAGNSIHADKAFLMHAPWNAILEHLHYRLFDVSAVKEMVRRWAPEPVLARAPVKKLLHQAREDVLESIDEARFYMTLLQGVGGSGGGVGGTQAPPNGHLERGLNATPTPTSVPVSIPMPTSTAKDAVPDPTNRTISHGPNLHNFTAFANDSKGPRLLRNGRTDADVVMVGGDEIEKNMFRTDVP